MNDKDAAYAADLLNGQGYFIAADVGFPISKDGIENELRAAVCAHGYTGDVTIGCDADGGQWTYYAYNADILSGERAKQMALRDAQSRRRT